MLLEILWLFTILLLIKLIIIGLYLGKENFNFKQFVSKVVIFCCFFIVCIIIFVIVTLCSNTIHNSFFLNIVNSIENSKNILDKIIILVIIFLCMITGLFLIQETTMKSYKFNDINLMLCSLLGFISSILSNTWMQLFFSLELATLPIYIMVANSKNKTSLTIEGAIKYFIISTILSFLFIFGMCLSYLNGVFFINSQVIFDFIINEDNKIIVGSLLILLVLMAKLPIVPFQNAVIDAYSITNLGILSFLLIIPKIVFLNIIFDFAETKISICSFLIFITVILTLMFTSIFALGQTKIKRFISYTSIFHNGFFLSLLILDNNNIKTSLNIALFIYIIMMTLFLVTLSTFETPNRETIDSFTYMEALGNSYPILAKCLGVTALSMAGLPPLAGFFMKFYILALFILEDSYALGVILIIFSIPIMYTYLRIIQLLFFKPLLQKEKNILLNTTCFSRGLVLGFLQLSNIIIFIYYFLIILLFNITFYNTTESLLIFPNIVVWYTKSNIFCRFIKIYGISICNIFNTTNSIFNGIFDS
jgi:NADH-quinone oxidoreductase subunit N